MNQSNHPFHMVTSSPWPILSSIAILSMMMNITMTIIGKGDSLMIKSTMMTFMCMVVWWRDIIRESFMQGTHTKTVMKSIKMGMIIFIISEAFLFTSLFWMLLHSRLSPTPEIGMMWPPPNILPFNPFDIPMANSALLISSGMFLTWAHYTLMLNWFKSTEPMLYAVLLGVLFMYLQLKEYMSAPFTMADSIYGSAFFIMTGFHGMHVMVGIIFMSTCLNRMTSYQLSSLHHLHFELSAWYWHFVDVVWIALYLILYF